MNALMVINWLLTLLTPVIPDTIMDTVIEMFNTLSTYVADMEEDIQKSNAHVTRLIEQNGELDTVINQKNHTIEEMDKWLKDAREDLRIHGLAIERAEKNREEAEYNLDLARKDFHRANELSNRLANKLHDEEVSHSKTLDDMAKLTSILLSDLDVFEKLVADTVHNGPIPRASKLIQICWSYTTDKVAAGPGEIRDYLEACMRKHG